MNRILVIAGTDSSGGAGLTRDTATAHALGTRIMPVVTAVTAQSDDGLLAVQAVPPRIIAAQITAALATARPAAVKIGMLGGTATADAVASALHGLEVPVVLDPVLKSTSGGRLFSGDFPAALFARASLITPNLDEASMLTGRPPAASLPQVDLLAQTVGDLTGARAVLLKGGHASGDVCTDVLFHRTGIVHLSAPRLPKGRRGTGCTLATAIACHLAKGHQLTDACRRAKQHVTGWLTEAG